MGTPAMDSPEIHDPEVCSAEPFERLLQAQAGQPLALFHSCGPGPVVLCTDPLERLTIPPDGVATAFDRLEEFLARHREHLCAGYLGYDLRDAVEPLPRTIPDDFPQPVLDITAYRTARRWQDLSIPKAPPVPAATALRPHLDRASYEAKVAAVVEHIRAGDIFQANLTQPFTARFDGDPRALFWKLCAESPAPFAAYLETGDGPAVLSSSPEEFLSAAGSEVRTRPIKGTRPRLPDPIADRGILQELLDSEKDLAELAMIVDLLRNDLGKVAVPGSVAVGPFPEHDSFAQVHHLFAEVRATLSADTTPVDLLRATFPGGSITGAPKLRCMEILEELEVVRRGIYTGAIGWFGPGPHLHLSVAIRTMVLRDGVVRCNTGGAVTADSDPRREYDETMHKAKGMFAALGVPGTRP